MLLHNISEADYDSKYDLKARSSKKQGHYEDVFSEINKEFDNNYPLTPRGQVKYKGETVCGM